MQSTNQNNATETQPINLSNVVDFIEDATTGLDCIQTLLGEVCSDLQYIIKFDGTKEDNRRKANLLNRRPVLDTLTGIALDYVLRVKENLSKAIKDIYAPWGIRQ